MWDDCLRAAMSDSSIERIPHHHQARHPPSSDFLGATTTPTCTVHTGLVFARALGKRQSSTFSSISQLCPRPSVPARQAHTWSPSTKTSLFSHVSRPNISFSHPLQKTAGDDIFPNRKLDAAKNVSCLIFGSVCQQQARKANEPACATSAAAHETAEGLRAPSVLETHAQ